MSSAPKDNNFDKGDVELTGSVETLMITLLSRAHDAESPQPVLHDHYAIKTVVRIKDQLGYDFSRIPSRARNSLSIASRALDIDTRVKDFLERHTGRPVTVLHLACGLDSRSLRVSWQGEGRLWIDADTREAVALRRRVMDEPEARGPGGGGEYRLLHPDIIQDGWIEACEIPNDRPVLVVCEGLMPYLTKDEVHTLLRRMVNHFGEQGVHGEIIFDTVGSVLYFLINFVSGDLKALGTRLQSYMNRPKLLEREVNGLFFQGTSSPRAAEDASWTGWFRDELDSMVLWTAAPYRILRWNLCIHVLIGRLRYKSTRIDSRQHPTVYYSA